MIWFNSWMSRGMIALARLARVARNSSSRELRSITNWIYTMEMDVLALATP
jgi:hypothetical protein